VREQYAAGGWERLYGEVTGRQTALSGVYR